MRWILVVFIFLLILEARENPFKPVIVPQESGKVAENEPLKPLNRVEIKLPSSARKIKSVKIFYQNIDGSIDVIEKKLDNDIDWHFPIVISHEMQDDKEETKKSEKPKIENDTKIAITKEVENRPQEPQVPKIEGTKIDGFEFVYFVIDKNVLYIYTKDEKIRDFPLSEPTKVVIDLKRPVNFKSKTIETKLAYFSEIAIGNHTDSYRLAIKLDGIYKYTLERFDGGYKITLK